MKLIQDLPTFSNYDRDTLLNKRANFPQVVYKHNIFIYALRHVKSCHLRQLKAIYTNTYITRNAYTLYIPR